MIVVKLMGGLGNQMFQYAYAMCLAKEYGEEILFDTSYYPEEKRLDLYNFNIIKHRDWTEAINESERNAVKRAQERYRVLQKTKRVLMRTEELGEKWFRKGIQKGYYFNFDPYYYSFATSHQENKYIYGYFQSEKYFANCKDQLKSSIQLSVPLRGNASRALEEIHSCNSVALHIRLGDYKKIKNSYLDVCTRNYYARAIEYVLQKVDKPRFFVFTNDAGRVERFVDLPESSFVVEGTRDFEDFELIRNCRHAILSNSSFSWWASYLNPNANKTIIGPTPWFNTLKRESDVYTPDMIKIGV